MYCLLSVELVCLVLMIIVLLCLFIRLRKVVLRKWLRNMLSIVSGNIVMV